jgi:ABC-type Fe3+/spermidine/putrescine transport system ATPase subunit
MGELRSILKTASDYETSVTPNAVSVGHMAGVSGSTGQPALTETAMTSLYVTHDQEEAFAIADRVLVMNKGQVEQAGSPVGLYRNPGTPFVARFLGMENLLQVQIVSKNPLIVRSALGDLRLAELAGGDRDRATLLIRPEAASLTAGDDESPNIIMGRLTDISFRGRHQVASVQTSPTTEPVTLKFNFDSTVRLPPVSSQVRLRLDPMGLRLLEPEALA